MKRSTPTLVLFAVVGGCGTSSSTSPSDATVDAAAIADANDAAEVLADTAGEAREAATDPCGPLDATWRRCAANPLATAGFQQADGRFELSIGDPDVQFDEAANLYRAWWSTGLAATYGDPDPVLAVKYATSADGVAWSVQTAPVIASHRSTDDWDYSKLETPSVIYVASNPPDRRWVMYYSGGNDTVKTGADGYTWYQLGVAFSADGTSFTRLPANESPYATKTTPYKNVEGLLLLGRDAFPGLAGVADGIVADPEAIVVGDTIHLFFSSGAVDASGNFLAYGVSHATSTDGVHFTMSTNPIASIAGSAGPSIVKRADGAYDLYFYRDSDADKAAIPSTFNPMFGAWRVTSTDLATWSAVPATREVTWDGSFAYEKYGWIATGDAVVHGGETRFYYVAFDANGAPSGWVVPTHAGPEPAVIALSMLRRAP